VGGANALFDGCGGDGKGVVRGELDCGGDGEGDVAVLMGAVQGRCDFDLRVEDFD
jgi:hypothetical protein